MHDICATRAARRFAQTGREADEKPGSLSAEDVEEGAFVRAEKHHEQREERKWRWEV
jgi:hypothetical protein